MTPAPSPAAYARHRLRARLRVAAYRVLALPTYPVDEPLQVDARDEYHHAVIVLYPAAGPAPASERPGRHFSPTEQRIWDALSVGPMRGPALAAAIGETLGGRINGILSNLVERGCLLNGPRGYARAPLFPAKHGPAAGDPT